jgi:hypothetical protein
MHNELSAKYSNIQSIPNRRKAFVDDILGFYNIYNRSQIHGGCVYSKTSTSPGCAIGRCLTPELTKELDNDNTPDVNDTTISSFFYAGLDSKFPFWMVEMGREFLSMCQRLHDTDNFWDETGPTEDAVEFVKDFINPLIRQ